MEFDETNGSQEEDENLDDVKGTQLVKAMRNMDIGELRPREMIDVEDNKNQVLSNSKASGSHDQIQVSTIDGNVQDQQVASSSSQPSDQSNASNQVQVLQPINVARDHLLDTIIVIF